MNTFQEERMSRVEEFYQQIVNLYNWNYILKEIKNSEVFEGAQCWYIGEIRNHLPNRSDWFPENYDELPPDEVCPHCEQNTDSDNNHCFHCYDTKAINWEDELYYEALQKVCLDRELHIQTDCDGGFFFCQCAE